MSETLVIRFRDPAVDAVDWHVLDGQGRQIDTPGHGRLAECRARAGQRRIVALMPGERVSLLDARVPTRKRQKILQAVPWVLEERLAQDVSRLHFALGPRQADDSIRVGVVGREDMQQLTELLAAAELRADAILPDFLALPRQEDAWTLLVESDRVLVRTGSCEGFSTDRQLALEMLSFLLPGEEEEKPAPASIHLVRAEQDQAVRDALDHLLAEAGHEDIPVEDTPCAEAPGHALAPDIPPRPPLDLGEGEFRMRKEETEWWRPWRPVVALAGAWLLVMAVTEAVHLYEMSRENRGLDEEIETVFRQALPDAERMVNPRLRMEQRLNALRGAGAQGNFLPAMAAMGDGLDALDSSDLRGLSYRPGVMDINLRVSEGAALDQFKDAVDRNNGFEATIQSANTRDDYVDGRLQIRGPGG